MKCYMAAAAAEGQKIAHKSCLPACVDAASIGKRGAQMKVQFIALDHSH
jgi:hypothetical protein